MADVEDEADDDEEGGLSEGDASDALMGALEALEALLDTEDDDVLERAKEALEGFPKGCTVDSFRRMGVMTSNKGFVITTPDGDEYQVTVVRR